MIILGGKIAAAYSDLLKNLWCKNDKYCNPWELKKVIS